MNIFDLVQSISKRLAVVYKDTELAQQYAWWSLEIITSRSRAQLVAKGLIMLNQKETQEVERWISSLVEHEEPIQYLIGTVPFGSLTLYTEHPVLIPRPETEEWALELFSEIQKLNLPPLAVADLCTGSGCIALLAGTLLPEATIIGTDISDEALALAERNRKECALKTVTFTKGDLFSALNTTHTFDIIVANPPYIAHDAWLELSPSVTAWEDYGALVADDEGFELIEKIIVGAKLFLKQNHDLQKAQIPQLVIEIGHDQGDRTIACMQQYGYTNVQIKKDAAGKDRVACGSIQ
jgi:release factor glutamine methyltransferase